MVGFFFLNDGFADDCSEKMYRFFMSLKQKDGSFMVAHHSEVDVRYVSFLLRTPFFYKLN